MKPQGLNAVISRVIPPCLILKSGHVIAASDSLLPDAVLSLPVEKLDGLLKDLSKDIIKDIKTGSVKNSYPYSWKGDGLTGAGNPVSRNVIFPLSTGNET